MTDATEVRMGRNFLRVGDDVKVLPSKPKRRDGFLGRVVKLSVDDAGELAEVEVVGPRGFRTLRPERIERVQQTRGGEKVERAK